MPEIASAKLSIDPSLLAAGTRVLDAGCGDGRHLAAAAGRGCRVVGIDYDPGELRSARAKAPHADLIVADATRLPFQSAAFDTVICTETLEHLPDDRGAMREMARVLRDDGAFLGAVPSHFTELPYFMMSRGYRDAPGGHVRIYAPHVLVARLHDCGLRVTSFRYVHFIDSLIWLRYCVMDAVRHRRVRSDFEAAVLLAVAEQRAVPSWRTAVRRGIARSRFIALADRIGSYIWPKSFTFVARKRAAGKEDA